MKFYVEPGHNDLCWACRMRPPAPKYMNAGQWHNRICTYENLLEIAEELGTFTVRELVIRNGALGAYWFGLVRHLLIDLQLHGLVEQTGNKSAAKVWTLRDSGRRE